jgi:hypothetical protein
MPQASKVQTPYDPNVILLQANKLYTQAKTIAVLYALLGLLIGPLLTAMTVAQIVKGDELKLAAFLGGLLGALAGLAVGFSRGHMLRFHAQIALCQLQTEINTRSPTHR